MAIKKQLQNSSSKNSSSDVDYLIQQEINSKANLKKSSIYDNLKPNFLKSISILSLILS